jgi:hypothetical protein
MKVKIFTVTKDEYDLIEDFIEFYGYIFGYNNLTIIDTGSTNNLVLDYYHKIKCEKNVNIVFENGYENGKQGDHFTKYMSIEKSKNSCDFLLGLDTDNFLILPNSNVINKEDYINYFKNLSITNNKFLIHATLDSVVDLNSKFYVNNKYLRPAKHCETFYKGGTVHINFYRCKNFHKTCNGNHSGITIPDQPPLMTDLTMVHYCNTGITRLKERTMNILVHYKYMNYIHDLNFETTVINYQNICHVVNMLKAGNHSHNGIHRIIWGFTSILRDFVYELFKKYASEEFCTIENIHKCMYSNQCVLHYINDFNMKTQYWEKIGVEFVSQTSTDYVLGMYGNTNFIYNRCEYTANNMISDFELFFKDKKNNDNNIFSKTELYNNCEQVLPYEIVRKDIITKFFDR